MVAAAAHDGVASLGDPAVGDGALQPREPSDSPDGAKTEPEAGEIEIKADAVGSVRCHEK
jgi:hypothetical protein